ncbi:hypothetical protein BDN70DRAFT_959930 [Pholiota conissans]|uniref:Uncharacterized protein n=1 Tax=Pholiota conissans TaxID=109636 RepID=A0A9P5YRQ1_9AGAR|nr:hypothetical protein BDN70DRAFT_959930 [Pholiota conissans]
MSTSIQGMLTGDSSPRLPHCMISSEKKLTISNGKFMQVLGDVHLYATSPVEASDWTSATQTTREDVSYLNMLLSSEGIQLSGNSYDCLPNVRRSLMDYDWTFYNLISALESVHCWYCFTVPHIYHWREVLTASFRRCKSYASSWPNSEYSVGMGISTCSPGLQHNMISSTKELTINDGNFMQVLGDVHLYANSLDANGSLSSTLTPIHDRSFYGEAYLGTPTGGAGIQTSGNYVVHGDLHQHVHYHYTFSLTRATAKFCAWMHNVKRRMRTM